MPGDGGERAYSSLGPSLRLLALALLVVAAQSVHGVWVALLAIARGGAPVAPGLADALCGLAALAVSAFFLRHADENTQALAGGGKLLPPLALARLLQPRLEHPLRELWARSNPAEGGTPMPASRGFGGLLGAGLAIAVPLWACGLLLPLSGRIVYALDAAYHALVFAACLAGLHFAALLAQRQDDAWRQVKPSVMPVPLRIVGKARGQPALPAAAPSTRPAAISARAADSSAPGAGGSAPPMPISALTVPMSAPPPPPAEARPVEVAAPSACPICRAPLAGRRCEACGAPVLAASFRVLQALGGGGARRTWLAAGPDGARVVLKELSIATAPDAQALDAFAREARMLRELRHPRLPAYLDAFQEEEGPRARLYLAYRYLDGISLQQELEERRYSEEEVLELVEQVLEILRHLHGLQPPLIHRDLKPANLIRRRDGAISVIDFGVARSLDRTVNSGTLAGTVGYMPPEQLAGQVDLTSDLYALGATALHLLTRTAPWEFMDGPELRLPRLRTAPIARALLRRMLAPRRAQRFSSAREALVALQRLRAGGRKRPRAALAGAGVAAATLALVLSNLGAAPVPTPAPGVRPAPPAPIAVQPAPPKPAALGGPLIWWRGGALSVEQVQQSLRTLPPWLKSDTPWWIQQHVFALVRRKLLAAEAEKRGLLAAQPAGGDRERLLAAALLETEARQDADWDLARARREAWARLTGALLAAAEVHYDDARLFQLEPQKLVGPLPSASPASGEPMRLEVMAKAGRCFIEVEPALRRYGGRCEGAATLAQALLDPETLQLVDLSPLPEGFATRFTDDFVDARQLARAEDLVAAQQAERALTRSELRVAAVSGTVSYAQAQGLLAAVTPALRRCLATALQESPDRALRVRLRIQIELQDGVVRSARVETQPQLPAALCAQALARPGMSGAGGFAVAGDFERAAGQPGRMATPAADEREGD